MPQAYFSYGKLLEESGNKEEAEINFKKAEELDPKLKKQQ